MTQPTQRLPPAEQNPAFTCKARLRWFYALGTDETPLATAVGCELPAHRADIPHFARIYRRRSVHEDVRRSVEVLELRWQVDSDRVMSFLDGV